MSLRWRIGLAAIIAAAVVGGFVPHAAQSVTDATSGTVTQVTQLARMVEDPAAGPVACLDATCGKGSPAPAAPSSGIALVAVVSGLVGIVAAGRLRSASPGPGECPPRGSAGPALPPAAVLLARPRSAATGCPGAPSRASG